jgi:hypothetical protein
MTKQVFTFESLPQMVATSDLVIEGSVQTVEPGRVLGEEDAAIQLLRSLYVSTGCSSEILTPRAFW